MAIGYFVTITDLLRLLNILPLSAVMKDRAALLALGRIVCQQVSGSKGNDYMKIRVKSGRMAFWMRDALCECANCQVWQFDDAGGPRSVGRLLAFQILYLSDRSPARCFPDPTSRISRSRLRSCQGHGWTCLVFLAVIVRTELLLQTRNIPILAQTTLFCDCSEKWRSC